MPKLSTNWKNKEKQKNNWYRSWQYQKQMLQIRTRKRVKKKQCDIRTKKKLRR